MYTESEIDNVIEAILEVFAHYDTLRPLDTVEAPSRRGFRSWIPESLRIRSEAMFAVQEITDSQRLRMLLRIARRTAEIELNAPSVRCTVSEETANIEGRCGGVFVTFCRGKRLRGCVGSFAATDNIEETIREVTRKSLVDSRFVANPITGKELRSLNIEISLLTEPVETTDPLSLVLGYHGIIVRRGAQSGCFLPKVASERSWNAEQFLSNCCTMKADLPADAWRTPDASVRLFTAQVFSENQLAKNATS